MVVVQHCEYTECYGVIHFTMVNFISCEFHLNKFFKKKVKGIILPASKIEEDSSPANPY